MLILQTPLSFSFSKSLTPKFQNPLFLTPKPSSLSLPRKTTLIRMGGGPRTYPGGVSKWQWKRMQAKKAKQLLKARLSRERQIYEMRKRAELKAAVSELERPWEVVEKAPNLFSVRADEQVKVLADRFQKPGGFDLWTEKDGPQLFQTVDELPSARFFPKGVVHSVKPYKRITGSEEFQGLSEEDKENGYNNNENEFREKLRSGSFSEGECTDLESSLKSEVGLSRGNEENRKKYNGKMRNAGNQRRSEPPEYVRSTQFDSGQVGFDRKQRGQNDISCSGGRVYRRGNGSRTMVVESTTIRSTRIDSGQAGFNRKQRGRGYINGGGRDYGRGNGSREFKDPVSEVYEMRLEEDGSYGPNRRKSSST